MAQTLSRTDNEAIYKRHVKTVYRVCYTFLKNPADTEDAVSDTFVKLIKTAKAFEGEEHEKAWLIRTAGNVCKDFLKHWSRRNVNIADYADNLTTCDSFKTDSLLEAVLNLPDKYKAVVHMYYYEGYTSVQIAKAFRKPQSTIRNYLHEARKILRERCDFDEE
ncbi:hypothetical protein FACS1894217_03040 [Clostridia bacterium]|nr:hypothetical protein FACS1894217_03040 [Clostridia bacterium]